MREIRWIVVHTAGAYDLKRKRVVHQSVEVIRAYHIRHNGWLDIGYHAYIEEDGAIMSGRPDDDVGAHAGGFNLHTLGVCVSGHGDFEPWNVEQLNSLVFKVTGWCREHSLPAERVIGHRETDERGGPPVSKTCPGVLIDMDVVRELVRARLATKV